MEKIWIFGGDGFVGRYLAEALIDLGREVVVCDIKKSDLTLYEKAQYINVDIKDPVQLKSLPISKDDICINLAANQYHTKVPRKNRKEYFFDTNLEGVRNILSVMELKHCDKLIQLTTDMVYGPPPPPPQKNIYLLIPIILRIRSVRMDKVKKQQRNCVLNIGIKDLRLQFSVPG